MQTSMYTPDNEIQKFAETLVERSDIKKVPLDHELLQQYMGFWASREYYSLR